MTQFTKLFAAAAISVVSVFAQGPSGRMAPDPARMVEMRVNMLSNRLSLTDTQKVQVTAIYTQAQTSAQSVRSSLQPIGAAMSEAVKKNDTASIDQLSATLGTLTAQLSAIERKADAGVYAILTAEQQAKFDMRGARHGHGPDAGGMGRRSFRGDRK